MCLKFFSVFFFQFIGKLWRIPGVFYFWEIHFFPCLKTKKNPQKLRGFFFSHVCFLNSYPCKAFSLGMFARRCVFVNSVAPTDVLQVEWLWNELFIGRWRDVLGGGDTLGVNLSDRHTSVFGRNPVADPAWLLSSGLEGSKSVSIKGCWWGCQGVNSLFSFP